MFGGYILYIWIPFPIGEPPPLFFPYDSSRANVCVVPRKVTAGFTGKSPRNEKGKSSEPNLHLFMAGQRTPMVQVPP